MRFVFRTPKPFIKEESVDLSRRYFLASLAGGLLLSPLIRFNYHPKLKYDRLIRPPGTDRDDVFLDKCIRCGQCMKICPTNVIQPAVLQTGVEGFYSPIMAMRLGYCDYRCNLCGQVCPTGAIEKLKLKDKQKDIIGLALFNKDRCLPWYKNENCDVCEKNCPIPGKAIRMQERKIIDNNGEKKVVNYPYIVEDLCNGCGKCEYVCPVNGTAGVLISRKPEKKKNWD